MVFVRPSTVALGYRWRTVAAVFEAVNRCSRKRETDEQLCDDLWPLRVDTAVPKAALVALNLFLGLGIIGKPDICRRRGDPCRPICLRRQDTGRGAERSCHAYPVDAQNHYMLKQI